MAKTIDILARFPVSRDAYLRISLCSKVLAGNTWMYMLSACWKVLVTGERMKVHKGCPMFFINYYWERVSIARSSRFDIPLDIHLLPNFSPCCKAQVCKEKWQTIRIMSIRIMSIRNGSTKRGCPAGCSNRGKFPVVGLTNIMSCKQASSEIWSREEKKRRLIVANNS